jgi:hypothetical protein
MRLSAQRTGAPRKPCSVCPLGTGWAPPYASFAFSKIVEIQREHANRKDTSTRMVRCKDTIAPVMAISSRSTFLSFRPNTSALVCHGCKSTNTLPSNSDSKPFEARTPSNTLQKGRS